MKKQFPITKSQLLYLQNIHHTDLKISNILNITVARVCQLRKKYGILIFTKGRDNYPRNKFIYTSFKESNTSKLELAKKNNLSIKTIIRIIQFFQKKGNNNDNQ